MNDCDRDEYKVLIAELLKKYVGPGNTITQYRIYVEITGSHIIPKRRYDQVRFIRSVIKDLREEGMPIGIAGKGYFLARDTQELEATIKTFHKRAISSLKQEAALKRITFNELLEQYEFEFFNKQAQEKAA